MEENQIIKIEVDGVMKDAEILKIVSLNNNNYAICAIDLGNETSDILACKIVKDQDGSDQLVDLETDEERQELLKIVSAMFS